MNLRDMDPVLSWGITVTLAYLFTPYVGLMPVKGVPLNFQILLMWTLLMIPPVYHSYREAQGPLGWKTLNTGWSILIVLGIVGNFAGELLATDPQILTYSYYHKWLLVPGLAFVYTAYRMNDESRKIYGAAAILNIAAALALFVAPGLQAYTFQTAALIQGLPMIADWYVRG